MPSDLRLDGETVVVQGLVLKSETWDLDLDHPTRRKQAGGRRRALVHDPDDGLTLNWDEDYPGGVTLRGIVKVEGHLRQRRELGGAVKAIVRYTGAGLDRCYNSQNPADPGSCSGFSVRPEPDVRPPRPPGSEPPITPEPPTIPGPPRPRGASIISFPFKVDDRVVLVTPEYADRKAVSATYSFTGNEREVVVRTWDKDGNLIHSAFTLVVL